MPRKPNTDTRRAEIVAALQAVMAKQGYEKATIQSIGKEAGLTPGLIHYHFRNKQEILVCLIKSLAAFAQDRFERASLGASNAMERLESYLEARLALGSEASDEVVSAWVMIGAEAVRQQEVREIFQQVVANELTLLTGLLVDCLKEKGRDIAMASDLAAGLLAMMEGAYQLSSAAQSVMPKAYAFRAALAYAKAGIGTAPPASLRQ